MQRATIIKLALALFAAVTPLFTLAATPGYKPKEVLIIQVAEIDQKSVAVAGAQLSFRVRLESEREVADLFAQRKVARVQIMNAGRVVTEGIWSSITQDEHRKLIGLGISFRTPKEANEAATALRSHVTK